MTRHVKASSAGPIGDRGITGTGSILRALFGALALLLATGALGATSASAACPNAVFRTGPSAKLPDCRAYELVTPEYTSGASPVAGTFTDLNNAFDFPLITSSGNSVVFNTVLGALSDSPGSGLNDHYRARRTADGWTTEFIGPTAEQTIAPVPGGVSPDHEYYFLNAGFGDLRLEPESTLQAPFGGHEANYLRKSSGEFELIARGSLGEDPAGVGRLITAGATHVIFTSKTQLEPQAPPTGSTAAYDRTPGGPTHVVSVLPGGGEPEGEFTYEGASGDGSDVAFADTGGETTLYVRHDNSTTSEVARSNGVQAGVIYAGVFGGQVFYVRQAHPTSGHQQEPGDLFSFDIATGATTQITDTGDAFFSHVSADGSHVYFISESEIGGEGSAGQPNLYVWSRAGDSTKFIAAVDPEDVTGTEKDPALLGRWTEAIGPDKSKVQGLALSNTRSTSDGSVFLFESIAQLTGFDNTESAPRECGSPFSESGGERCTELYRYDTASEALTCVSCPAGSGPATGYASIGQTSEPTTALNPVASLSADGSTVFFQSTEDLLPADGNGHQDVYEWKEGSGLALISTGQAASNSFLYGVTPNGSDVTIWTREALLPQDQNVGTGRIYDARVDGGFPPPESTVTEPCSGDACQGAPAAALESPQVASSTLNGSGNLPPKPTCAKGKRRVVSRGSERCVKPRHRKHHKHRRAHAKGRAAR